MYNEIVSSLNAIIYGLACTVSWGISDFFTGRGAKSQGPIHLLFLTQIGGLVLMSLVFLLFDPVWVSALQLADFSWRFLLLAIGFFCFYRALSLGEIGIVCVISTSYGGITALLLNLFGYESLSTLQWMGIGLLFIGLLFVSITKKSFASLTFDRAILYAFGAAFSWAVYYVFLPPVVDAVGWFPTIFYRYLCTVLWLCIYFLLFERSTLRSTTSSMILNINVVIIIIGELLGQFFFHFGMTRSVMSILVPVSGLGPVLTVVLAFIFLHERLTPIKYAGIAITLCGLILLH